MGLHLLRPDRRDETYTHGDLGYTVTLHPAA